MIRKSKVGIHVFQSSLLLAAMACTGSWNAGADNPTPQPVPTADHTGTETYLGDYVAQNGYFFAALEVQDPATPYHGADVEPDTKLVAIKLVIGNQTGKRFLFSDLDVQLIDTDGKKYDPTGAIMAQESEFDAVFLDPGERLQGWIPFFIPKNAHPVHLNYGIGFTDTQYVRLSLTPPPAGHTPLSVDTSRTAPQLSKLGEDAKGDGYLLRALRVEDPSQTQYPDIYKPAEGTRFVAVEIKIANIGTSVIDYDDFYVNLVDASGFVYAVEYFGREGNIPSDEIKPDSSVQGWVSFTIPKDAMLESIKWIPDIYKDSLWAGLSK